jgi:hypothetical protein
MFDAWSAYRAGRHDHATRWVYVKSSVPRARWCAARGACHLLREDPQEMLRDAEWLSRYHARCKESLFHQVMQRATHVGTAQKTDHITWHAFAPWAGGEKQLADVMRRHQGLWSLIARGVTEPHMRRALFALHAACGAEAPSWQLFYAHLLGFRSLAFWDAAAAAAREPTALFEGDFVPIAVTRLADLHRFIHRHVFRSESSVRDAIGRPTAHAPDMRGSAHRVDRTRRVLRADEVKGLCVYGLAAHHLEDSLEDRLEDRFRARRSHGPT